MSKLIFISTLALVLASALNAITSDEQSIINKLYERYNLPQSSSSNQALMRKLGFVKPADIPNGRISDEEFIVDTLKIRLDLALDADYTTQELRKVIEMPDEKTSSKGGSLLQMLTSFFGFDSKKQDLRQRLVSFFATVNAAKEDLVGHTKLVVENSVGDAKDSVKSGAQLVKEKACEAAECVNSITETANEKVQELSNSGEALNAEISAAKVKVAEKSQEVKQKTMEKVEDVKLFAKDSSQQAKDILKDSVENVKNAASGAAANIANTAANTAFETKEMLKQSASNVKLAASNLKEIVVEKAEHVKENLQETFGDKKEAVKESLDNVDNAKQNVVNIVSDTVSGINTEEIKAKVTKSLSEGVEQVKDAAKGISAGLKSSVGLDSNKPATQQLNQKLHQQLEKLELQLSNDEQQTYQTLRSKLNHNIDSLSNVEIAQNIINYGAENNLNSRHESTLLDKLRQYVKASNSPVKQFNSNIGLEADTQVKIEEGSNLGPEVQFRDTKPLQDSEEIKQFEEIHLKQQNQPNNHRLNSDKKFSFQAKKREL